MRHLPALAKSVINLTSVDGRGKHLSTRQGKVITDVITPHTEESPGVVKEISLPQSDLQIEI